MCTVGVVATSTAVAPTTSDARRAAEAVAGAGACRVLLYGSVAAGRASAGSDIDLVAMFDDIDYSRRFLLSWELRDAAEAVVECPVEVFVTDRAEWRRRTRDVPGSFEAGIAPAALVLVDRPMGAVRWDKEIGLPDNNTDEALGRLDEASKSLHLMNARMLPDEWEILEPQDVHVTLWRMIDICSSGAMAVETSLKALAAASGKPAPHKHRIDLLLPLSGSRTDDVRTALPDLEQPALDCKDIPYGDLSIWRQAGTYIADRPDIDLPAVSAMAPRIARAAVGVAAIAAEELAVLAPEAGAVIRARRIVQKAGETLGAYDLITGGRIGADTP